MKCRSSRVLAGVLVWLMVGGSVQADERTKHGAETAPASGGDAAVQGLLRAPRTSVDPALAQLEALWAELAERPLAKTAGKQGLDRARVELSLLRELIGRRADADAIARRKQLVWAALSLSDREMARAELAEALRAAMSQRAQAESELETAKRERENVERTKRSKPVVTEPAK